jgi:regulator of protease activity HflC (stomatin/prohibitin superfamily)
MVVERLGKFARIMPAGLHLKMPFFEQIAYSHSLKEQVLDVDSQHAITKDNVKIKIDGVLYFKIVDAYKASYNIS